MKGITLKKTNFFSDIIKRFTSEKGFTKSEIIKLETEVSWNQSRVIYYKKEYVGVILGFVKVLNGRDVFSVKYFYIDDSFEEFEREIKTATEIKIIKSLKVGIVDYSEESL